MSTRRSYHVFGPLTLICLGLGLLLAQTGWLSSDGLWRLGATWPVFVILAGLSLIYRSILAPGRAAIALLVSFALLCTASVTYAFAGPAFGGETVTVSSTPPRDGATEATLVINTAAAELSVRTGDTGAALFRADVTAPSRAHPSIRVSGDPPAVTIANDGDAGWPFGMSRSSDVVVVLSDQVRWSVTVNGAAVNGNVALGGVATRVRINAAAGDVHLALGAPHGTVPVEINGAAATVDVSIPDGVPCDVAASGLAASIAIDGHEFSGIGRQSWTDPAYSTASDRYAITANGASARARVTHG